MSTSVTCNTEVQSLVVRHRESTVAVFLYPLCHCHLQWLQHRLQSLAVQHKRKHLYHHPFCGPVQLVKQRHERWWVSGARQQRVSLPCTCVVPLVFWFVWCFSCLSRTPFSTSTDLALNILPAFEARTSSFCSTHKSTVQVTSTLLSPRKLCKHRPLVQASAPPNLESSWEGLLKPSLSPRPHVSPSLPACSRVGFKALSIRALWSRIRNSRLCCCLAK
jgi:hypothetical protein